MGRSKFCLILLLVIFIALLFFADSTWLLSPPYWDSIQGNFKEGIWLYRHHWNYKTLAFDEVGYSAGGPRAYFISIYPLLISLLFRFSDSTTFAFVILHIFSFVAAAGVIIISWNLISELALALRLRCLMLLTLITSPMFLSQSMAMNAEVPIACAVVASFVCFFRLRFALTAILIGLAFLLKANGAIIGLGLITFALLAGFDIRKWGTIKVMVTFLLPLIAYLAYGSIERNYFKMPNQQGVQLGGANFLNTIGCWFGFCEALNNSYLHFAPELYLINNAFAVFGVYWIIKRIIIQKHHFKFFAVKKTIVEQRDLVALVCVCMIAVYHTALIAWCIPLPRYYVVVLAPCIILLGVAQMPSIVKECLLVVFLVMNVLNFRGGLYEALLGEQFRETNTGASLETTTRQQLLIHRDIELVRSIETRKSPPYIFAPWPYDLLLSEPLYGYLQSKPPAASIQNTKVLTDLHKFVGSEALLIDGNNCFVQIDDRLLKLAGGEPEKFGILGGQHPVSIYHFQKIE